MSRSSFSKAYEEIGRIESMEMTFTIEDADLDKLHDILKDINVRECPWFEVQDKHGNKAKYYREPQWIPCSEKRLPEEGERVLCTHLGGLNPNRQVIEHIYQNGKFVLGWDMDMNPSSPTFMQRYMGKIVAWMPLPEPYKENNDQ